jgi:hypothetical protein
MEERCCHVQQDGGEKHVGEHCVRSLSYLYCDRLRVSPSVSCTVNPHSMPGSPQSCAPGRPSPVLNLAAWRRPFPSAFREPGYARQQNTGKQGWPGHHIPGPQARRVRPRGLPMRSRACSKQTPINNFRRAGSLPGSIAAARTTAGLARAVAPVFGSVRISLRH